jgi:tetratricopeptide (TPR) repeat protein
MSSQQNNSQESNTEPSLAQKYQSLIEEIVKITLQGKIRSQYQVHKMVVENFSPGTGEIFERCLEEEINQVQAKLDKFDDELKQAKAGRQMRALDTIQKVWQEWQKENQAQELSTKAVDQIIAADSTEKLTVLLQTLDINQDHYLTNSEIEQLAKLLAQQAELSNDEIKNLANGLSNGLKSLSELEDYIISWIYDQSSSKLGFAGIPGQTGPWELWAKRVNSPFLKEIFRLQAENKSVVELANMTTQADLTGLVEVVVVLRGLQQGLVNWFNQQPYSAKWGKYRACSTLMTFAILWGELSKGFERATLLNSGTRQELAQGCFQMTLQILRAFALREDFPLYGGIFASFSGDSLRRTLDYLDRPLQQLGETREKGRILTLLGYSQRTLGKYPQAEQFYQQALEIARSAKDYTCEIANLNHLSATSIAKKDYPAAINYSQRALILAREKGDRLGQANSLVNLGYSNILQAYQREQIDPEFYQQNIDSIKQALSLIEDIDDIYASYYMREQTQALGYHSLGIAYLILERPQMAIEYFHKGAISALNVGEGYLQGINWVYLAEAYYKLENLEVAVFYGCLAMYVLERISAQEWRQAAGLISILEGKMGVETWQKILQEYRSKLVSAIGVDGFDYLPQLLKEYRNG